MSGVSVPYPIAVTACNIQDFWLQRADCMIRFQPQLLLKKITGKRFPIVIHLCARLPIISACFQSTHAFQQRMNYASGRGNGELFCVREKKPSHVRLPTAFHWSHYLFICFLLSHGKSHISPQMCYCWSCREEIDSIGAGVVKFKKVIFFFSSQTPSSAVIPLSPYSWAAWKEVETTTTKFLEAAAGILFSCWSNILLNMLFDKGLEGASV